MHSALRRFVVLLVAVSALAGCSQPEGEAQLAPPTAVSPGSEPDGSGEPAQPDTPPVSVEGSAWDNLPAAADADIAVSVDAAAGWGGGEIREIDRRFYGMNIADWQPEEYQPAPNPEFLTYLRALEPGVLRWPAGHTSQTLVWERAPEAEGAKRKITAAHVDAYIGLARELGAEPLIAVNLKTGSAEGAADLVRYVNVEKGHGVTWWQLGNEPDHRDGLTASPEEYAADAARFAEAMRAVDPNIKLVGGEIMTGAHVLGSNDRPNWLTPILRQSGDHFDAVSWHYYPLDSHQKSVTSGAYPSRENLFQEEAVDWKPAGMAFADEIFPHLEGVIAEHAPGAEIWVTEIAEDSANGGIETIVGTHAGALWTADILGRFAAHGPDAMTKFVFKSSEGHHFTLLDANREPRPAYSAYWLYANHWGDRVVSAESSERTWVNAHAALRDDGSLSLILVNKGEEAALVDVGIEGFDPSKASRIVLQGESYGAHEVTVNGVQLDETNVEGETAPRPEAVPIEEGKAVNVPALSVVLILYEA